MEQKDDVTFCVKWNTFGHFTVLNYAYLLRQQPASRSAQNNVLWVA
jgi:hypothetical protein